MSARDLPEPRSPTGESCPSPGSSSSAPRSTPWICILIGALALLGAGLTSARDLRAATGGDSPGSRTTEEEREYQIKAAFLLNFIRYTTWPESAFEGPNDPLVLLVVGDDPFGKTLDETFKDEKVGNHRVVVRRVGQVPEAPAGHLVFCGRQSDEARARLIAACAKRPVLLVGESSGFAEDGACVNFYLQERKTRFEINVDALAAGELEMSPAVLKLARIVHTRRER